jgi:hypothetical protein
MSLKKVSLLLLVASACAGFENQSRVGNTCSQDSQCRGGQICFSEGCAVPAEDFVVEVSGQAVAGEYAQDFVVPKVTARLDFELRPIALVGEVGRELEYPAVANQRVAYRESVRLTAEGFSERLPRVRRSQSWTLPASETGYFSVSVGSGIFDLVASANNLEIPPVLVRSVRFSSDTPNMVPIRFASIQGMVQLAGRILKRKATSSESELLLDDEVELQAFDVTPNKNTGSARVPVSQKVAASKRGEFSFNVSPEARMLPRILLNVTPSRLGSLTPSQSFMIDAPFTKALDLELGGRTDAMRTARGIVIDESKRPIVDAHVQVQVQTNNGGTVKSAIAVTNASGEFTIDVVEGLATSMTVVPPADSAYSATQLTTALVNDLSGLQFPPVTLSAKQLVSGKLTLPSGAPAVGVEVRAVADENQAVSQSGWSPPLGTPSVLSDGEGLFSLPLDRGLFRLVAQPTKESASTAVTIDTRERAPTELVELNLVPGERISGTVIGEKQRPIKYATVRFFRTSKQNASGAAAVLVGEAVADSNGEYSVILPK